MSHFVKLAVLTLGYSHRGLEFWRSQCRHSG